MDKLFVYVDGGARSEPGEAGIGIAMTDADGAVVEEISRLIGRTTTEVAEYRALIEACRSALLHKPESVIFFTDNQRVANHVNGVFETREPHVKHLVEMAVGLLNQFPQWRVNYVDAKVNLRAPRLVEQAFHRTIRAQVTRERLELLLLARTAGLSEPALQKLVEYAERLEGEP
ncbi:MAG: ribonuclease HI family protein [Candidatus Bipolaricaulis sp.]|nr:ribonuclease HI family protein [Candidatus Bipolaricaulis sp.]MDD5219281.1 ribonuclease HI family protein [Candidatus Bipolaricaulis sp.]MDD5646265.1 ribonuclease HI family protein [Candidatus Bipolaricaulis sp.]